ncbi:MAG: sigma-54-dependent Fis family transcriptional regulator [Planctomycetes bacterium]|nr:sigma-54-dependent Fis family transcriptional regulator [Planctomycetota bacterium]
MSRILVIDDEPAIRESLRTLLAYEKYEVSLAENAHAGLAALGREEVQAALLDIKMPGGMDGMECLLKIREGWPEVPVIMISAHGTVATAVEATHKGAFDFIEKPLDRDRLLLALRNALSQGTLSRENRHLRDRIRSQTQILGESPGIRRVRELIRRVAGTDARVLITGDNGTGKELVARSIHEQSARAAGPFVDINCAALPAELIESELFGHEEGSFTGASSRRIGKFEAAKGGTLFMDEIGDMPLPAQAKVLRVLEENVVQRVGGNRTIPEDVRVEAATNKNVAEMIAARTFREDLYFRLNVFPIQVPPLRDRREDLALLASHFLALAVRRNSLSEKKLSEAAAARLTGYGWPGNVRELRNLMERLAIVADADVIAPAEIEALLQPTRAAAGATQDPFSTCRTYEEFKETSERMFIELKLRANDWNVSRTAEEMDMPRSNLYKKLEKYGLK